MASRSNPWPSFVDLFTSLFIIAFGGLVITTSFQGQAIKAGIGNKWIDSVKNVFKDTLSNSLRNSKIDSHVGSCGDDICFDLYIHFLIDRDVFSDPKHEVPDLEELAIGLKNVIDSFGDDKSVVEIDIEGHTDCQQPHLSLDQKGMYLYNWNLSSRRAQAVLYEFYKAGLKPPSYNIVAVGYADSKKICLEDTEDCNLKNRRTTIRIRIDTQKAAFIASRDYLQKSHRKQK